MNTDPNNPATEKEVLEKEKLSAEVDELKARTSAHRSSGAKAQKWVALVGGVVAILGGAITAGIEFGVFLKQRSKEYQFKVNNEIITLTQQLGSNNPIERANAALLLAGFENDAVPILINNLRRVDTPELETWLIESLKLIISKESIKPQDIFKQLVVRTELVFDDEYKKEEPGLDAIRNHIRALSELAVQSGDSVIVQSLRGLKTKLHEKESKITGLNRDGLKRIIDDAILIISNQS